MLEQIVEYFLNMFNTSDWPPRWICGNWTTFHGWLYILSDLMIWSAYFALPIVILRFISRKPDPTFLKLYILFASFILACGLTHLIDAIIFWFPIYRFSAMVRFVTGIISWITVFYAIKYLPIAFTLRSQNDLTFEIEQRKNAEEQVKKLNAELERLIALKTSEVSDYKYALDESCIVAITDHKGIIKYVNSNFCRISKYTADELIGQDHRIINSGFHDKIFISNLWSTISSGKIWKGELKNKAKDGTYYWVDTTIVPFMGEDNTPYQYVAIRADITNRKLAEEEIIRLNETLEKKVEERTSQLQQVNDELNFFCYSVSHDLRAPIRAINGYSNILLSEAEDKLDQNTAVLMDGIMSNSRRMGQLIDDLLEFSRVGRKELVKSEINMMLLVNESIQLLHETGLNKNAQIIVNQLPNSFADYNLLRQVMLNLLSNALKYSSTKEIPKIEIGSFEEEQNTVYYIKDNGVGFDMKYYHKLFEVFQRLHQASDFEGTGVGLALVFRIIQKHGGRVWADAIPGEGATFYFTLKSDFES